MRTRRRPSKKLGSLAIKTRRENRKEKHSKIFGNSLINILASAIVLVLGILFFESLPVIEIIQPTTIQHENPFRPTITVKNLNWYSIENVKGWTYIINGIILNKDGSLSAWTPGNYLGGITNTSPTLISDETTSISFDIWRLYYNPTLRVKSIDLLIAVSYSTPFFWWRKKTFIQRYKCNLLDNGRYSWMPLSVSEEMDENIRSHLNSLMEKNK
jgi:hypothetical protein